MKLQTLFKTTLSLVAAIGLLSVVGCSTASQVRANPMPREQSLDRSSEENLNLIARTQDNRVRGIYDDMMHIFFLDRNTTLTEYSYPAR